jgi:hypothetical protein
MSPRTAVSKRSRAIVVWMPALRPKTTGRYEAAYFHGTGCFYDPPDREVSSPPPRCRRTAAPCCRAWESEKVSRFCS